MYPTQRVLLRLYSPPKKLLKNLTSCLSKKGLPFLQEVRKNRNRKSSPLKMKLLIVKNPTNYRFSDSKLRAFQFKFLHKRLAANDFLCKLGLEQTNLCSFCEEAAETLGTPFLELQPHKAVMGNSFRMDKI